MSENADASHREPTSEGPIVEDSELLRRYAEEGMDAAFAELVRRRIGLVYSVALRQCHGDRHRAEDVTQTVFADLARKAAALARRPVLAGWLHRSTQFAAAGMIRTERRRTEREREAQVMEKILATDGPEPDWDHVRPILDQALNEIDEGDRDAVLLRFFDGRPFAEIGQRLGLSENTTRMRVERALEKLNAALGKRGVTSTAAAVGLALAGQTAVAIPAGLATAVTGGALAGGLVSATNWVAIFMGVNKLQVGITVAIALASATGYFFQAKANAGLRQEITALQPTTPSLKTLSEENQRLTARAAEIDLLGRDDAEFKRLAQSAAELKAAKAEAARVAQVRNHQPDAAAELQRINREGTALVEQYKDLSEQLRDSTLTAEARTAVEAALKAKLEEIKAKQIEAKTLQDSMTAAGMTLPSSELAARGGVNPPASVPGRNTEGWLPADGMRTSFRVANADVNALLAMYQRATGSKIVRDSLEGVTGTFDFRMPPSTKEEIVQALRNALSDHFNVTLEPTADGQLVARRGAGSATNAK